MALVFFYPLSLYRSFFFLVIMVETKGHIFAPETQDGLHNDLLASE